MSVSAPLEGEVEFNQLNPLYFDVAKLATNQINGLVPTPFGEIQLVLGGGAAKVTGPTGDSVELLPHQRLTILPSGEIHVSHKGEAAGTKVATGVEKTFAATGKGVGAVVKVSSRLLGFVGLAK